MVLTTTDVQLFQILRQKIGEVEAEALVSFVDSKIRDNNEANLKILATKEDIALVKEDIALVKEDIALVKEDIAKLRGEMNGKIASVKADLIKWMFIFWIGQVAVTFGFILLFIKK